MTNRIRCLVLLGLLAMPLPLAATPINYSFSGVASGGLGTASFYSTEFVITIFADTDLSVPFGDSNSTYFGWQTFVGNRSATVDLTGIGNTIIGDPLLVWANPNCDCLGFSRRPIDNYQDFLVLLGLGFDLDNPYDLRTSIGPVSAPRNLIGSSAGPLGTPLGELRFDSADQATFQATLVPLPSVSWLFGSALGLLAPWVKRGRTTVQP